MRVLLVSDIESKYYWDFFEQSKLDGIDLIISCGDLAPQYLSFLATFSKVPVIYIHGNHDGCYVDTPPDGCVCVDDDLFIYNGMRILGLGGSMSYTGGTFQYTESDMKRRYRKLKRRIRKAGGIDILLTHSPAFELGDGEDLPHRGFKVFLDIMDTYSPKYFFHGHMHLNYGRNLKRQYVYKNTTIINGFDRFIIDI